MIRKEKNNWGTLSHFVYGLESGRQNCLEAKARAEMQDRRDGAEKDK